MESIELTLFHDSHELCEIDYSLPITASLINHSINDLITDLFTLLFAFRELISDSAEIPELNKSCVILVVNAECFAKLILLVTLCELLRHKQAELVLIDKTIVVLIDLGHHDFDLVLGQLNAKGTHGISQLVEIDVSRAILIEKFESAIDLLLLHIRQTLLLLLH